MNLIDQTLFIRQQAELFLVDTCTIRHHNGYSVIDGEYAESFTDLASIPCRVINKSGKVLGNYDSQQKELQYLTNTENLMLQLPFSTDINTKDKVILNSTTYDVVHVPVKHSLMGAFIIGIEKQK
jgi:hypothetical protein